MRRALHVGAPNISTINISGPITIEAWIRVNAINRNYQDIVYRPSWGQAVTNTGKLKLDLYQSPNQYTTGIGSTTVTTNAWHHVAGVFDGNKIRIYLNGVLDGSVSTTNGPASGTSALHIGKSTYTGYYFGGLIDEVRISAAALYGANFTPGLGPASNTRGLWKFDGRSLADGSRYDSSYSTLGQVWKVSLTAEDQLLSSRSYNLRQTAETMQRDGPRRRRRTTDTDVQTRTPEQPAGSTGYVCNSKNLLSIN